MLMWQKKWKKKLMFLKLLQYIKKPYYRNFQVVLIFLCGFLCIGFRFSLYSSLLGFPPQIQRAVHLGFVLTLVYLLYPARAEGKNKGLPWYDLLLAVAGAAVCAYIVWQYDYIVLDAGPATDLDFYFGCAAIVLVLEATRRIVGVPITLVAVIFLLYAKFGNVLPGMLGHRGFSAERIVSHMYLTTEGLFGCPWAFLPFCLFVYYVRRFVCINRSG